MKPTVFFNIFVKNNASLRHATLVASEQMSMTASQQVFVVSIGPFPLVPPHATLLKHLKTGSEIATLDHLWQYCVSHSNSTVVYIHSKGTYHRTRANENLRHFLTRGALSDECAGLPDTCNVCSSRMSPLPHPHTPGNMWLARCSYIRRLIRPIHFSNKLDAIYGKREDWSKGTGRYSSEHWVHSHPTVSPCDLYGGKFVWNYKDIPSRSKSWQKNLRPAPRFDISRYYMNIYNCSQRMRLGCQIQARKKEYSLLYPNASVPKTWYGESFFVHN